MLSSFPSSPPFPSSSDTQRLVRELREQPTFKSFHQAFEVATGLPLVLRPLGSFQFPLEGSRRHTAFYLLAARCGRWCGAFLQFEERLEKAADAGAVTMENLGGFHETAVPVRIGRQLVGHLRTGEVFIRPPTRSRFARVVSRLGRHTAVPESDLESAFHETRVMEPDRYESSVTLLQVFAQQLGMLANQVAIEAAGREPQAITKARAFIDQHFSEDIRLADAAHAGSVSGFYFCKLFHQVTGCSFTHYLARLRVEAAIRALENEEIHMCDAAFAAGFQSLSQFNRVFRQITGKTPTAYRAGPHAGNLRKLFPHENRI